MLSIRFHLSSALRFWTYPIILLLTLRSFGEGKATGIVMPARAASFNANPFPCSDPDGTPISLYEKTNGRIPDMPCISCVCQNSTVSCPRETCDYSTCPVLTEGKKAGSCCRNCKRCHYAGQSYANDQHWQSSQDACRTLTCKGGVTTVSRMQCVTPCRNPKREIGYCCPLCPADSLDSALVNDPCIHCSCTVDKCHCYRTACPALLCKNLIVKEGQCCPECADEPLEEIAILQDQKCYFKGEYYEHETSFRPDDCTLCKCQEGSILCRRFVCPVLECPKQRMYWHPGLCCPRCRDTDPLPCTLHTGNPLQHGDEWWSRNKCSRCKCYNGELKCQTKRCQHPHRCPQGYRAKKVPGQCCHSCVEKDAACTIDGDAYKSFDGKNFNFNGSCRYVIAKQRGNVGREIPSFRILSANKYSESEMASSLHRVTLRLKYADGSLLKISLLQGMRLKENGKRVRVPRIKFGVYSAHKDRSGRLLIRVISPSIKIAWDGKSSAEISVPTESQTQLSGLCGNYNLDVRDDYTMKNGELTSSVKEFGESWRISSWRKCGNQEDRAYHRELVQNLRAQRRKDRAENAFYSYLQFIRGGGGASFAGLRSQSRGGSVRNIRLPKLMETRKDTDPIEDGAAVQTSLRNGDSPNIHDSPELDTSHDSSPSITDSTSDNNLANANNSSTSNSDSDSRERTSKRRRKKGSRKKRLLRRFCTHNGIEFWRDRSKSLEQCEILKSDLFQSCRDKVRVSKFYRWCIKDACSCPSSGRCYCESLGAYATRCEKKNILVNWKSQTKCDSVSECPDPEMEFSLCVSCQRTCSTKSDDASCESNSCTPGCQCPKNKVLFNNRCIDPEECPT